MLYKTRSFATHFETHLETKFIIKVLPIIFYIKNFQLSNDEPFKSTVYRVVRVFDSGRNLKCTLS